MAASDAERWDRRWGARTDHIEPTWPDALDVDTKDRVPTAGRALDVACGRGAQTVWLARRGLSVVALDASATAIEYLEQRARHLDDRPGPAGSGHAGLAERIDARRHDLDGGLPDGLGEFDLVVCQRFRAPHLYESLVEHLTPGGWLTMTILSESGATDPGEFHAPPGELTLFFDRPGVRLVAHREGDGEESIVVERSA